MSATARILTIDDSPTNQKLMNRSLSPYYEVIEAMSGTEGLSKLNDSHPELILLDVDMPGLNGYDTCREIRTHQEFRDTPILFVSCLTEPEDQLAAYEAGADDYINKPVNLDVLRAKVALNLSKMEKMREHDSANTVNLRDDTPALSTYLPTFLMQCLKAKTLTDVVAAFDTVCGALGLQYVLRHHGAQEHTFTNDGMVSTLEDVLLDQSQNFYPLLRSSRLILGNETCMLIIRNIQRRDNNDRDLLTSGLTQMLEAMHARLTQIKISI